ncbi:MAG: YicC/YloC family endoribonuclease [Myxococcota bacterium]
MLRSMTGFGSGQATQAGESISVELKSVNHKFCEVKVRLPRELAALEVNVQKTVKDRVVRGAVEVTVRRAGRTGTGLVPQADVGLAKEYRRAWSELASALGVPDEVRLRDIALLPNVIRVEEAQVNLDDATRALDQALAAALDGLGAMRTKEGESLEADLAARIALVSSTVTELVGLAPKAVEEHRARLAERLAELARGVTVDPQRLAQEVAIFAERTDVAEEMTRLRSHIAQFEALLAAKEPVGRKMDFLVQEMHREVNTTGAKSQHPEISARVVALKAELERIREQVQNVE